MINIGLGGFNVIERCGILRWGKEMFPEISIHILQSVSECEVMTGVALNTKCYAAWKEQLPPYLPVLLMSEMDYQLDVDARVKRLNMCDDANAIENAVIVWLQDLPAIKPRHLLQRRGFHFTKRETEILRLLRSGASNEEIAKALGIKITTVKTYLRHIYERFGATNRAHAVALYKELDRI